MKVHPALSFGIVAAVILTAIVVILLAIVLIVTYNGIVKSDKAAEEAKAQIETVLQRRLDLIPNLVETVKGYAQHEQETLEALTKIRSRVYYILQEVAAKKSLSKEDMEALAASQTEMTKSLKTIFALAENYPDLKASSNFLALQDQLEGTENRIAVARQTYNYAVRMFNTKIDTFPGVVIAPMFGFSEKAYFEAKEEAAQPVEVKF